MMDKQIAFTSLTVKAVDTAKRMIRGIATSATPDRVNDVVEPLGISYKNPLPLLMHHKHDLPVGTVTFGKPTAKGVPFEATFPDVAEPSQLRARVEEAFQSCVAGLIRHVSIGFRPLEYSVIEDTGGLRFTKSEVYELSLVSVPAQPDASFEVVKAFDAEIRASMGDVKNEAANPPSGSTEKKLTKSVKLTPKEGKTMSIAEKLKSFEAERGQKHQKMTEMMEKSMESGETFDEATQEEYATLESEVKALDDHIEKAKKLLDTKVKTATPVTEKSGQSEQGAQQNRQSFLGVQVKKELPKGIEFARLAKCKAIARLEHMPAAEVAKNLYGSDSRVEAVLKAAVAAGTTTQTTWAAPLVGDESSVFADFVEYLRPMTILGRMGQNGIPGPRVVPFRTRLIAQTTGGNAYWTGEGAPKPLTKFDFTGTTLEPLKVATIAVATMELLRDSSPSAEAILRDSLAAAVTERLDIDFVDPAKTASAGVSPASITNGVTPVTSSGNDADAIRCDIKALYASFIAANNAPTTGVFIMSSVTALALSLMLNPLGQREFPGITMMGGTFEGLPVVVSEYVPTDTAGGYVFLVNASDIYVADEGGVSVDMSDQASLQMLDNPTNNPTGATTPTTMVSMFQTNCVAFRAERTINWGKRRASAVAVLDGVNWGSCA